MPLLIRKVKGVPMDAIYVCDFSIETISISPVKWTGNLAGNALFLMKDLLLAGDFLLNLIGKMKKSG